ncbi:hypothetical protein [Streptococcus orisasini]|uniref:hypothetical protein n=1 Tax=Streptococcus orisasini TaxID=1080071 RepID=UPI0007110AAA|nr:hypothetical protein [Streptococcus orisasini]
MPRNFKEAMFFTTMMCGLMVLGMSAYNLTVAGHFSWKALALGYIPGFVLAFLADTLIVGPLAKKVAFSFLRDHHKRWQKIVTISGLMILGMVSLMSLYGLLINQVALTLPVYLGAWLTNFVMAVPLNFLLVGPVSRFILGHLQKPFPNEEKVEDFDDDDEIPTII